MNRLPIVALLLLGGCSTPTEADLSSRTPSALAQSGTTEHRIQPPKHDLHLCVFGAPRLREPEATVEWSINGKSISKGVIKEPTWCVGGLDFPTWVNNPMPGMDKHQAGTATYRAVARLNFDADGLGAELRVVPHAVWVRGIVIEGNVISFLVDQSRCLAGELAPCVEVAEISS